MPAIAGEERTLVVEAGQQERKTSSAARLYALLGTHRKLVRTALYLYVVLIVCPIRFFPLQSDLDSTYRFALNYATTQGPAVASQMAFTYGPLGYVSFPQHLGANLGHGLLLQTGLWLALAAIFADLFFLADFPLRNLALFAFCFGLATPLFSYSVENLMLAAVLTLAAVFYWCGGLLRYMAALVLLGVIPLFKLTAAMIGIGALLGFLIDRTLRHGRKALPEIALAAVLPAAVTTSLFLYLIPSFQSFLYFLRGSAEITRGYSAAMSIAGPQLEPVLALEAMVVLVLILWLSEASSPGAARFYALFLVIPLFVSFKHGFVRQDVHVIIFFCFTALALALVSLKADLGKAGALRATALVMLFFVLWQDHVGRYSDWGQAIEPNGQEAAQMLVGQAAVVRPSDWGLLISPSGAQAARMLWGALRFGQLKQELDFASRQFPEDSRIEPEIVNLIGDSPVASLSHAFTNLAASGLQLKLYPTLQRYTAYTPYLDGLNAAWIRDQGPRFLVFDGGTIDGRDSWAESPAMWLEVYRWYDTRLLGTRNLLLQRRAEPRFTALEPVGHFSMPFAGWMRLPASDGAVFWTRKCNYSVKGKLQSFLYRDPSVFMIVHGTDGYNRSARLIPEVISSPVMGNFLPNNLPQFAAVFYPGAALGYSVDNVMFVSSENEAYSPTCEVEILRAIR